MLHILHLIYLGDAQVRVRVLFSSKAPVLTAGEIRANIASSTDCDLDSMMYPQIYISGILSECFNALTVWCPYCLRLTL